MADKAKITAKENVFTLEVSGVATGDSGTYSCRVSDQNQVTITCSANLEVHSRKYSIMILLLEIVWLIFQIRYIFIYVKLRLFMKLYQIAQIAIKRLAIFQI